MQLLFHLVYYHSICFGHGSCPSSEVIHKTVKAVTSVCQCVCGEVVLFLVVSVNVITTSLKMCGWTRTVSETCRVIINQVKQKLHLVGYLLNDKLDSLGSVR